MKCLIDVWCHCKGQAQECQLKFGRGWLYFGLRYFVPQVPIAGKFLNGYPMFSVKNILQNVKLIGLWGKHLVLFMSKS